MASGESAKIKTAEPRVMRVERAMQGLGDKAQGELTRLIEGEWRAQAQASDGMADLVTRANAPLIRALEADAEAKSASAELQRRRIQRLETEVSRAPPLLTYGGPMPTLVPSLHAGINMFGQPYDFQLTDPKVGQVETAADRLSGTHQVTLDWGFGGARFATAGVGLVLSAGVQGVAHIRPYWVYSWQAIIGSHILSAHTDGAARVVVQDVLNGQVLLERTWPLWNYSDDTWQEDDGYVDSWALAADVFVNAGQVFSVTFLSTAMVDDSGSYLFGFSLARAHLEMRVPLFWVEMGP